MQVKFTPDRVQGAPESATRQNKEWGSNRYNRIKRVETSNLMHWAEGKRTQGKKKKGKKEKIGEVIEVYKNDREVRMGDTCMYRITRIARVFKE